MKRKQEVKKKNRRRSAVHDTPMLGYIFITITYSFYFGSKGSGGKGGNVCVCGQGLGALGHQEKHFYFDCFGACKYVCATWDVSLLV